MAVTLVEIARELKLSHTTVSRVLNDRDSKFISAATRERVLSTAAKLGYEPNLAARGLRNAQSNLIGVFASPFLGMWNGVNLPLLLAAEAELAAEGYNLFYAFSTGAAATGQPAWSWDGGLVMTQPTDALLRQLRQAERPVVGVNELVAGFPAVLCDYDAGTRLALVHLQSIGHRRIAYANVNAYDGPHTSVVERHRAYLAFCREQGLEPPPGHEIQPAEAVSRDALVAGWRRAGVTAILAYHHTTAVEVYGACLRAGLAIPREMSLLAFTDEFPLARLEPPLTVVAPQGDQMGRAAARLLLGALADQRPGAEQVIRVPELLVERRSVAPPPR